MAANKNIVTIPRYGTQQFDIGGVVFTVDVFHATAELTKLNPLRETDESEWLNQVAKLIESFRGPGDCSGAECIAFNNHVVRLSEENSSFFGITASQPQSTV